MYIYNCLFFLYGWLSSYLANLLTPYTHTQPKQTTLNIIKYLKLLPIKIILIIIMYEKTKIK